MKFDIFHNCRCRRHCRGISEAAAPISFASINLPEEYANAFRTESYNEFWARVLELSFVPGKSSTKEEQSTAARLPSYRLFVEQLLDPDQPTATRNLAGARHSPENLVLLTDYFAETANASFLCGLLLKQIEQIRLRCRPLKSTLTSLTSQTSLGIGSHQAISDHLDDLSETLNHFRSQSQLRLVQSGSAGLLKRLESGRKKARARLRRLSRLKNGLVISLVVVTASASVVGISVAFHGLVAVLVLPALLPAASFPWASKRRLARWLAQLDAAAKGTYIMNRDLDTVSRLVARLHEEVEHMLGMLRFCFERRKERLRPTQEVVRQLMKNDSSFKQQLDDLEEHLFLCFMTINKARNLVMKEVLAPGRIK